VPRNLTARSSARIPAFEKGRPVMRANIGDRVVIRSRNVGVPERCGKIVEVRGADGTPPYLVEWDGGSQGVFYPGSDATIEPGVSRQR